MHRFTADLLQWWAQNKRKLPWKNTTDPYLIWLSEVILQQTRVEQGLPYYLRFIEACPTLTHLANMPTDAVMRLWEGLGYYSRARNLLQTARIIANELQGVFPDTYDGLLALKGIGAYTAAAIASFAYNLPHAVVDGNVYRVLARYLGIETPIDSTVGKKQFAQAAQILLEGAPPAHFNQAIMDFGALQCVPLNPNCNNCPLQTHCQAFLTNQVNRLPVKAKKIQRTDRFFHYFVMQYDDQTLIHKRTGKDIWQDLWQFPVVETRQLHDFTSFTGHTQFHPEWLPNNFLQLVRQVSPIFRQQLTHQTVFACFYELPLHPQTHLLPADWLKMPNNELSQYAFPKIINLYLSQQQQVQNEQKNNGQQIRLLF